MIQLGIAGMRPPVVAAAATAPARIAGPKREVEFGTTGTAVFGSGYIRELGEYNPAFSGGPFSAYPTWEKMRRGDAQVASTLMAMKLPVRCAEWKIQPPDDATPVEMECAELVEKNLFDDLDFDRALENLLMALDFGSACHEDVWTATNGQIRLKKLAARLPLTFYTWDVDGDENLTALHQRGFHGGSYGEFVLPADKIALYTFRQEGANFGGRSILREMYQHWYTKSALYKIDAIAAERNGMGVPVGVMAESATVEDRKMFERFLKQIAAHQDAYAMLPFGYSLDLKGVTGQVRNCWESIQHHNMQISMAGLAQFMIMGQGSKGGGGNRSLGETMSDFFYLSLQTLANQLGDAFTLNSIARLAAYNYGPDVRPPSLVPQRLIAMKFESVVDALQKLGAAKILTPDPDIEMWVRKEMGAPAVERAEIVKMRATTAVPMPGTAPDKTADAGAGAGQGAGAQNPDDGDGADEEAELARRLNARSRASIVASAMSDGVKVKRLPVGAEKCLALAKIVGALDAGRDAVAGEMRAAKSRVQAGVVQKLVARRLQEAHRVSLPLDEKLVASVEAELRKVYAFGVDQVGEERQRQRGGDAPADASVIRGAAKRTDDQVGLFADAVVSEWQNDLTARAARVTLDLKRKQGDQTDGEVFRLVEDELNQQSDKWMDKVAAKGTNEAFAEGRSDGFDTYADDIDHYIQSALLDINTCGPCASADGMTAAQEEDLPGAPNPDCEGGDLCRCVVVAVFKSEGMVAA